MECASPVWHSGLTTSEATTLERLQARMARTILRAPWDTSKSIMLATLEWPSLRWRRAVVCMSLFYRLMTLKLTAGKHDRPFPDVIPFNTVSTSSNRQHRKPHQILLPNIRPQVYLKSYLVQAAIAWNALPNSLQTTSHLQTPSAVLSRNTGMILNITLILTPFLLSPKTFR